MRTVEEAAELFTGIAAGRLQANGQYPANSLFARVIAQLKKYDRILAERHMKLD